MPVMEMTPASTAEDRSAESRGKFIGSGLMPTDSAHSVVGRALLRLHSERGDIGRQSTHPVFKKKIDANEILTQCKPCQRKKPGEDCTANRRRLPRRAGRCSVTFCFSDDRLADVHLEREWPLHSAKYEGTLTDLSLTGIAFVCEHPVPAGVTVLMNIANRQLGSEVEVAGRVLRVSIEPDDRSRVICTLQRPLNYREYNSIGWSQMPQQVV